MSSVRTRTTSKVSRSANGNVAVGQKSANLLAPVRHVRVFERGQQLEMCNGFVVLRLRTLNPVNMDIDNPYERIRTMLRGQDSAIVRLYCGAEISLSWEKTADSHVTVNITLNCTHASQTLVGQPA